MLEVLSLYHNKWVSYVIGYGGGDYSEDIVQEMYLRLHRYSSYNKVVDEGRVNIGYVRWVLNNMTKDFHKAKKKIEKISIGEGFEIFDEDRNDEEGYRRFLQRLDEEINSWSEFDRKVFKLSIGTYGTQNVETHGEKVSIRQFSKGSGISNMTIYLTMKRCKDRIKAKLGEDWQDYINEDWERI